MLFLCNVKPITRCTRTSYYIKTQDMAKSFAWFGLIISSIYCPNSMVIYCATADQVNIGLGSQQVTPTRQLQQYRKKRSGFRGCGAHEPKYDKDGFPTIAKDNMKVQFLKEDDMYIARFQWNPPKAKNGMQLHSYFLQWTSPRYFETTCEILKNTTNTIIIHESEHWKRDWEIEILIIPEPTNIKNPFYIPFDPFEYNYQSPTTFHQEPSVVTDSVNRRTGSVKITSLPASVGPAQISNRSSNNMNTFKLTAVCIVGVMIGVVLIAVAVYFYRRKRPSLQPGVPEEIKYFHYVSYCAESETCMAKIVEFTTWFRRQGYDVQMDIMQTSSNETQLREMGRLRFGVMQLEKAKNVFMIVSPSYLKLCRLDERETSLESLSKHERIVYSEITHIRNELCSTIYRSCRFIPVLLDVKETELPFWIKVLVVYTWPDDKFNNRLLYRLNEQLEFTA